jgi:hypothetical protein
MEMTRLKKTRIPPQRHKGHREFDVEIENSIVQHNFLRVLRASVVRGAFLSKLGN